MARRREVSPRFFANEQLAQCTPHTRLLFIGLWCLADREGRLEDRPKLIGAEVFPYEDVDCAALIDELERAGFVRRYEGDGRRLILVCQFTKHQHPHPKEVDSALPPPPWEVSAGGAPKVDLFRGSAGQDPQDLQDPQDPQDPPASRPRGRSLPDSAPPLARWIAERYRDIGDPVAFALVQAEANPGIDLLAEAKRAYAWETSDPRRKKRQHGRFLSAWFSRAQDQAASNGHGNGMWPQRNGAAKHSGLTPACERSEFKNGEVRDVF